MEEKINFDVDWSALFPGKTFAVGNTSHNVKPLNIEGISKISEKIKSVLPLLEKEGITIDNIDGGDKIIKLIPILLNNAPDIISDATGIELTSLAKFPPAYMLELVTITIQVNLDSKEELEKNFESLTETLKALLSQGTEKKG